MASGVSDHGRLRFAVAGGMGVDRAASVFGATSAYYAQVRLAEFAGAALLVGDRQLRVRRRRARDSRVFESFVFESRAGHFAGGSAEGFVGPDAGMGSRIFFLGVGCGSLGA